MDPNLCIVPILGLNRLGKIDRFLGTGSFVALDHLLLTAEHVIRDWPGKIAVVVRTNFKVHYVANVLFVDEKRDIALLHVPEYKAPKPLEVPEVWTFQPNKFVVSLEYGTTTQAGKSITFHPATRIGNIVRILNLQSTYGLAGEAALELSFPALRGASGAPVVTNDEKFELRGMIVANVSYHLLPAQIERVVDERNSVEETISYMLPQALAVNVKHIWSAIETARGLPESPLAG